MEERDRRRWDLADEDKDTFLVKTEFQNFLHPEDAPHMRDIVVQETLEDIDKDGDGQISIDEYIGDMYRGDDGENEPDWVKSEREQFQEFRDKNKDGHMDLEEVIADILYSIGKNWGLFCFRTLHGFFGSRFIVFSMFLKYVFRKTLKD